MANNEFRSIWMGRTSIAIVWMKEVNGDWHMKVNNKYLPLLAKYRPILQNFGKKIEMFEERNRFDLNSGLTDETIRFYPFDINTLEPYYPMINVQQQRLLESLNLENSYKEDRWRDAESYVSSLGSEDAYKEKIKKEYDFFNNSLKPSFVPRDGEKKK